jgi:hypothetical protein
MPPTRRRRLILHVSAFYSASVPSSRPQRLSLGLSALFLASVPLIRPPRPLLGLSALFLASMPLIRPPRPLLGLSALYRPQRLILGLRAFFSASAPTASAPYTRPQRPLLGLRALLSAMMGFLPPPLCPRGCSYQRPSQFSAASLAREGARNRSFCLSARCVRAPYMSLLLRPEASNSFAPYIVRDKHHPCSGYTFSRLPLPSCLTAFLPGHLGGNHFPCPPTHTTFRGDTVRCKHCY